MTSTITTFRHIFLSKNCLKNGKINFIKKGGFSTDVCCPGIWKDNILVSVYNDEKVNVVDLSLNLKVSVKVAGRPRGIAVDKLGRIFVSLPNEREVLEVYIITKSVKKLFSTEVQCWGILWMNQQFIIASGDKIEMYRNDGLKQKEISTEDAWMISCKENKETLLYTNKDTIIENSQLTNKKSVITVSGTILRGIDTDIEGNIYTVGTTSNKLYQLSPDGNLLQEVDCSNFNLNRLLRLSE